MWKSTKNKDSTRARDGGHEEPKRTIFFGSARAGTTRPRKREGIIVFSGTSRQRAKREGTYCIFGYLAKSVTQAFWLPQGASCELFRYLAKSSSSRSEGGTSQQVSHEGSIAMKKDRDNEGLIAMTTREAQQSHAGYRTTMN
jgi:hypothetical protein